MTNQQVYWYNKLVDEIVRRYVDEVDQITLTFHLHLGFSSVKKMILFKYSMILNVYVVKDDQVMIR